MADSIDEKVDSQVGESPEPETTDGVPEEAQDHGDDTAVGEPADPAETSAEDDTSAENPEPSTAMESDDSDEEEVITVIDDAIAAEESHEDDDPEEDEPEEDERDEIIRTLKAEKAALESRVLRAHADMENFKKRSEREKLDSIKFANKQVFFDILNVLDNFERALFSVEDPNDNFVIGVTMIQKQLLELLKQNGVEEIEALGRAFDPYLDEAMAREETSEHEENTILEVFQKGFRFQGLLLRPTKVKVAAAPAPEETTSDEDQGESSDE